MQQVWANWLAARAEAGRTPAAAAARRRSAQVRFNPAVSSRNYLVPGLIAVIMTLTGALADRAGDRARVGARHDGSADGDAASRMREILLAKLMPYFVLGMGGMAASVAMAVFLFGVPLRGSIARADRRPRRCSCWRRWAWGC